MSLSRRTFLTSSTAGAAAVAIPSLAFARQQATPAGATPVVDPADLETRVLAAMEQHGIPGAIVLYDAPETGMWKAALGVANIETGEPMTTDMHMRIGSITKTFTSTMILQLVDQGALAMDDTLANLLPSQASLPNADAITLRHLLTMQSGLPDYVSAGAVLGIDPTAALTDEDLVAFIADMDAEFSPGEDTVYSNTNYILLGMIAGEVTGTPWAEIIQASILDEVGLANTLVPTGPELPAPSPRGYVYDFQQMVTGTPTASPESDGTIKPTEMTLMNPTTPGAAGNMISTVDDLYTWMGALVDGSLLSPELQADRMDFSDERAMESPIGEQSYGLGLTQAAGAIGHDGGITGFRSSMQFWPDTGTTLITLANVIPTRDNLDPAEILISSVLGE